jgi:hypothetical protein
MKRWNDKDIDIIKKYYKEKGVNYCCDILKRTRNAVIAKAKDLNIKIKEKTIWLDDEIIILKENYKYGRKCCFNLIKTKTIREIQSKAKYLNLSVDKKELCKIFSKNAIEQWKKEKPYNKYNVNPDVFLKIDRPEIAYILGLLWTDGYIINKGKGLENSIKLETDSSDSEEFLIQFEKIGKWNLYTRTRKGRKKSISCIHTSNLPIVSFLMTMDYDKKSFISADKIINYIPVEYHKYFFRGAVDGDGSFYYKKKYANQFHISSTINQDWTYFEKLCQELNIKYSINKRKHKNKNGIYSHSSSLRISNYDGIVKLGNYIYDDYVDNKIGLKRKYDKFLNIKMKD